MSSNTWTHTINSEQFGKLMLAFCTKQQLDVKNPGSNSVPDWVYCSHQYVLLLAFPTSLPTSTASSLSLRCRLVFQDDPQSEVIRIKDRRYVEMPQFQDRPLIVLDPNYDHGHGKGMRLQPGQKLIRLKTRVMEVTSKHQNRKFSVAVELWRDGQRLDQWVSQGFQVKSRRPSTGKMVCRQKKTSLKKKKTPVKSSGGLSKPSRMKSQRTLKIAIPKRLQKELGLPPTTRQTRFDKPVTRSDQVLPVMPKKCSDFILPPQGIDLNMGTPLLPQHTFQSLDDQQQIKAELRELVSDSFPYYISVPNPDFMNEIQICSPPPSPGGSNFFTRMTDETPTFRTNPNPTPVKEEGLPSNLLSIASPTICSPIISSPFPQSSWTSFNKLPLV